MKTTAALFIALSTLTAIGCAAGDTAPGPMGMVTPAPSTDKPATAGASGSAGSNGSAGAAGSTGSAGASGAAGGSSEPAEVVASECPASAPTSGTCSLTLVCRYGSAVFVCNPGSFWDGAPSSDAIATAQRTVDAREAQAAAQLADAAKADADRTLAVDLAMCDHVTEAQAIANCSQGSTTVTACSAAVMCDIAKAYQTARDADAAAASADAKAASF